MSRSPARHGRADLVRLRPLRRHPEDAVPFSRSLADAGFQYFVANVLDGDDETIELLGTAVMPAID
ncbi:MAG TPA: hypothetical protein VH482_07095 [Thermomicrobiales bacterium]